MPDNGVFLGVAETIAGSPLFCGVGIAQCLFQSLVSRHLVIGHVRNIKKLLNELFP